VLKITDGVMRHLAVRQATRSTSPAGPIGRIEQTRQDSEEQATPVG
jgi:hypothetical protein